MLNNTVACQRIIVLTGYTTLNKQRNDIKKTLTQIKVNDMTQHGRGHASIYKLIQIKVNGFILIVTKENHFLLFHVCSLRQHRPSELEKVKQF